jgi:hypothetical protein
MGASAWINLLLLSAALSGCATAPTPQWLDAHALCRQQWEATSNPPPTAVDDAYIDQCMVARGYRPR